MKITINFQIQTDTPDGNEYHRKRFVVKEDEIPETMTIKQAVEKEMESMHKFSEEYIKNYGKERAQKTLTETMPDPPGKGKSKAKAKA